MGHLERVKRSQKRKNFFFEKKKQKTFDYVEPTGAYGFTCMRRFFYSS